MRIGVWRWRPADAIAVSLAAVMTIGLVWLSWRSAFPPDGRLTFVDIEWYRRALDELAAGRPMSSQLNYPPISLVVLSPLRGLPERPAPAQPAEDGLIIHQPITQRENDRTPANA